MVKDVVLCKDCKHRPHHDPPESEDQWSICPPKDDDGWYDYKCPLICDDNYYSRIPLDDFFCGYGERRENV